MPSGRMGSDERLERATGKIHWRRTLSGNNIALRRLRALKLQDRQMTDPTELEFGGLENAGSKIDGLGVRGLQRQLYTVYFNLSWFCLFTVY